ncbi:MAG: hypothetical protein RPU39_13695 [Candidatus Sedimenticola sp. (ex Thyasira tokunagai)]
MLLRWRVDPVCFAFEALRVALLPYQAQVLLDLADAPAEVYDFYGLDPSFPKRRVLLPSGHGLGKTRVLAVAIWWHKLTHRASKRLCTAPTSEQLTGGLWGEVRKMNRRLKSHWPDLACDWEVQASSITHKDPDWGDWVTVARTARPEKPEGLQGAHALDDDDEFGDLADTFGDKVSAAPSGGIMVIVEEASGVDDSIREVLKGALSEPGARFIAPGNPTRPDGWFADDTEKTQTYAVHHLDCRMSDQREIYSLPYRRLDGSIRHIRIRGRVSPEYWSEILADCDGDEDHDVFRVRVRGVKPRSAFTQTIKSHWIDDAESRSRDEGSNSQPVIISLDFGLTADKHAICGRQGFNILDGDEWLPPDTPDQITLEAARRAIDWQVQYKARYIIGDSNGLGRGAMEYLHEYFHDKHPELKVRVINFNAGAGAIDKKRYYRRRDEMWFKKGRQFFSSPRCSIPRLPGLKRQLTAPGYHEDATKRIKVEGKDQVKKRLNIPSGNLADGVLQTLMVEVFADRPVKAEAVDPTPKVFSEHFKRLRMDSYQGECIR